MVFPELLFMEQSFISPLREDSLLEENNSAANLAIELAERLDFVDVQILRKFYMTGKDYPFDCQPHCFPILYHEMKTVHKMRIGVEGFRKRLERLVKTELLLKIKHSNPVSYSPVRNKDNFVRAVITKFFLISGLTKFL
ncbi:MAG: hypothetical protein HYT70_00950 [Candidatus Aenigmarchaeota archaeon]|nr:hypothetical protein [Candidatus Aenigmarchaeota archaeon]